MNDILILLIYNTSLYASRFLTHFQLVNSKIQILSTKEIILRISCKHAKSNK